MTDRWKWIAAVALALPTGLVQALPAVHGNSVSAAEFYVQSKKVADTFESFMGVLRKFDAASDQTKPFRQVAVIDPKIPKDCAEAVEAVGGVVERTKHDAAQTIEWLDENPPPQSKRNKIVRSEDAKRAVAIDLRNDSLEDGRVSGFAEGGGQAGRVWINADSKIEMFFKASKKPKSDALATENLAKNFVEADIAAKVVRFDTDSVLVLKSKSRRSESRSKGYAVISGGARKYLREEMAFDLYDAPLGHLTTQLMVEMIDDETIQVAISRVGGEAPGSVAYLLKGTGKTCRVVATPQIFNEALAPIRRDVF